VDATQTAYGNIRPWESYTLCVFASMKAAYLAPYRSALKVSSMMIVNKRTPSASAPSLEAATSSALHSRSAVARLKRLT